MKKLTGFLEHVYDTATIGTSVEIYFAFRAETYDARDPREQRVIFTDTDILSGHDRRTTLPYDDFPDAHFLAVSTFNAEIFRV